MMRALFLCLSRAALVAAFACAPAGAGTVVIGHPSLAKIDAQTVQKIFTGKVVEVGGVFVTAVNHTAGSAVRNRFLLAYIDKDDEAYTAYWTVRRYIGKGTPPREMASSAEVIQYVQSTPGAIGYIEDTDLKPSMNVLLRK